MIIKDKQILGEYEIKVGYKQFLVVDPRDGSSVKHTNFGEAIIDAINKNIAQIDKELTISEYMEMYAMLTKNFSKQ